MQTMVWIPYNHGAGSIVFHHCPMCQTIGASLETESGGSEHDAFDGAFEQVLDQEQIQLNLIQIKPVDKMRSI